MAIHITLDQARKLEQRQPLKDAEGFIGLLENGRPLEIPQESEAPAPVAEPPALREMHWDNEPVLVKLRKIREVVLDAKTPEDVLVAARGMTVGEWLNWVVKLTQRCEQSSNFQVTTIRVELPDRGGSGNTVVNLDVPVTGVKLEHD